MRFEALDPVKEAVRYGLIDDEDEDAKEEFDEQIDDVPAFSVNG
jgi:hypothetical protein